MAEKKPGRVLFDFKHAIDIFETRVSVMSNLDYDLDDIIDGIFTSIQVEKDIDKNRMAMAQGYMNWSIKDGPILSTAFLELFDAILREVRCYLRWENGILGYHYESRRCEQVTIIILPPITP